MGAATRPSGGVVGAASGCTPSAPTPCSRESRLPIRIWGLRPSGAHVPRRSQSQRGRPRSPTSRRCSCCGVSDFGLGGGPDAPKLAFDGRGGRSLLRRRATPQGHLQGSKCGRGTSTTTVVRFGRIAGRNWRTGRAVGDAAVVCREPVRRGSALAGESTSAEAGGHRTCRVDPYLVREVQAAGDIVPLADEPALPLRLER